MQVQRLREWREARGMSQKTLAVAANASQWSVLRAEHGAEVRPTTARKYAEALDITVSDLMADPPLPAAVAAAAAR